MHDVVEIPLHSFRIHGRSDVIHIVARWNINRTISNSEYECNHTDCGIMLTEHWRFLCTSTSSTLGKSTTVNMSKYVKGDTTYTACASDVLFGISVYGYDFDVVLPRALDLMGRYRICKTKLNVEYERLEDMLCIAKYM